MGKILSLKYCTASGNDNWKENPPKYHFSQIAVLSLTGFGTITDINGTVVIVDVDINEVFIYSGKYVEVTAAPTEDPNKTPAPTKAPVTNPPAATEAPKSEDGGCGSSSAIAQVMLILGAALVIKKKK
jgi:hypothetical protein